MSEYSKTRHVDDNTARIDAAMAELRGVRQDIVSASKGSGLLNVQVPWATVAEAVSSVLQDDSVTAESVYNLDDEG